MIQKLLLFSSYSTAAHKPQTLDLLFELLVVVLGLLHSCTLLR